MPSQGLAVGMGFCPIFTLLIITACVTLQLRFHGWISCMPISIVLHDNVNICCQFFQIECAGSMLTSTNSYQNIQVKLAAAAEELGREICVFTNPAFFQASNEASASSNGILFLMQHRKFNHVFRYLDSRC